jgi:hypothetical protein
MRLSLSLLVLLPAVLSAEDRDTSLERTPSADSDVDARTRRAAEEDRWRADAGVGDEDREENYIDEDMWELNFDARLRWDRFRESSTDIRTIGGDVGIHRFVTDWLQLGFLIIGQNQEVESGPAETETSTIRGAPALTLNFPTGTPVVPFLRGAVGVDYSRVEVTGQASADDVGFYWQAGGGLRFFVTHWASINLLGFFEQSLFDEDNLDETYSYGAVVGISLYWGGDDKPGDRRD